MKRILSAILIAVLCIGVLTACKGGSDEEPTPVSVNDPAVVGTWTENNFDSGFIFNADGTGLDTFWNLSFTYKAADGSMELAYDEEMWGSNHYSYTVEGDSLTMTRDDDPESTFTYNKSGSSAPAAAPTEAAPTETQAETPAEEGGEEAAGEEN
ncbi:MAG: hypothetical protein HUJ75_06335 [Parasporobacterium sp.]|nr:hypothetical protein [Parasporobacterium sp.]